MKKSLYVILAAIGLGFTGSKEAYKFFDQAGKESKYEAVLKAAAEADIVFFGELHDNPIHHWLQYELAKDLHELKKTNLLMGAEMLESDDQLVVNEYLTGKISEKTFKDECKLWPNHKTDYKPLLDFAKTYKLQFIATNIPRRYANLVYTKGLSALDSLEPGAKQWMVPLPMKYNGDLKCYKDIVANAGGHGGDNLPKSQAIKDATMAHFILKNWSKGKLFLHFNGSYHSNYHESICWYLKQEKPDLKIVVISSAMQKSLAVLEKENEKLGDFVLVTPENMTRTH
ncbi:MAG: ChaN family lipoprotein [Bacteroidia bacterium]|nr:ChaN family lipoprotein [Bacteroidia bacterium]